METLKAISKRKSTRAFLPEKQVGEADLKTILSAGCAAPVGAAESNPAEKELKITLSVNYV